MNPKRNIGKLSLPIGSRDHVQGPETAAITLVEYGDFECPHSQRAVAIVKTIQDRLDGQVRFVFRHFPLAHKHPHAQQAAEASEAAAAQKRFWEMYEALFENQEALEEEALIAYAAALNLDADRFTRELEGGVHAPRVKEDTKSGLQSGVTGTPEFFINGVLHNGEYNLESLMTAIRRTGLV